MNEIWMIFIGSNIPKCGSSGFLWYGFLIKKNNNSSFIHFVILHLGNSKKTHKSRKCDCSHGDSHERNVGHIEDFELLSSLEQMLTIEHGRHSIKYAPCFQLYTIHAVCYSFICTIHTVSYSFIRTIHAVSYSFICTTHAVCYTFIYTIHAVCYSLICFVQLHTTRLFVLCTLCYSFIYTYRLRNIFVYLYCPLSVLLVCIVHAVYYSLICIVHVVCYSFICTVHLVYY